ncbi:hypothetical protein J6590_063236 [Homalodisca vitripennis]|nr:hypothetical protein J6590_063236 [Homalodisca vitripennis]
MVSLHKWTKISAIGFSKGIFIVPTTLRKALIISFLYTFPYLLELCILLLPQNHFYRVPKKIRGLCDIFLTLGSSHCFQSVIQPGRGHCKEPYFGHSDCMKNQRTQSDSDLKTEHITEQPFILSLLPNVLGLPVQESLHLSRLDVLFIDEHCDLSYKVWRRILVMSCSDDGIWEISGW